MHDLLRGLGAVLVLHGVAPIRGEAFLRSEPLPERVGRREQHLDRRQPNVVRKKLEEWNSWATHSGLDPFGKVARTIGKHLDGIVAFVATGLTNARSEGTNGKVRTITRRSYGFHSAAAFIALNGLCCSDLELQPAHTTPRFH